MGVRTHIKALRALLACLVVAFLLGSLLLLYPPAVVFVYALMGRSPFCSAMQTLESGRMSLELSRARERYSASQPSLTLVESRDGFNRWSTPQGNTWLYQSSERVLAELLAQQESRIYGSGASGVRPGDVVLDCGAHVGLFTRQALTAGAHRVIAIEPGPENLECLRRNLAAEINANRVLLYPKGVLDREGVLQFHTFAGNSAADTFMPSGASAASKTYSIAVTTIDKLVDELALERVDFIKMDIKGSTEGALRGARKTLHRFAPRLAISTEETSDNPAAIIPLVRSLGPAYKMQCGYCALVNGSVMPMVLRFYH
jgi:FkbM family methyltransferase